MKKIEDLAHRMVRRYGTSSPFELCDRLNVGIQRPELPESTRALYFQPKAGKPIILLNSALGERESRYCCAHELGHILLHPGMNAQTIADLTDLCLPRYEREADLFAACLLIDPDLDEWALCYDPLSLQQIACLSGLPERVVGLRFSPSNKK